jgi:hypothetical protein
MALGLDPHLRLVGGNSALNHMKRVSSEARWPPLKVVASDGVLVGSFREPETCTCPPSSKRTMWKRVAALSGVFIAGISYGAHLFTAD